MQRCRLVDRLDVAVGDERRDQRCAQRAQHVRREHLPADGIALTVERRGIASSAGRELVLIYIAPKTTATPWSARGCSCAPAPRWG